MIISTRPSYHGATIGALATTGYPPLNVPFRALMMHSPKTVAPFCYHCPLEKNYPECGVACARELRDAIGSKLYSGTSEIQRAIIAPLLGL